MNFLEALASNPPVCLKPDRPASVHLLSWQKIQLDEAAEGFRQQKEQELVYHSERLAGALQEKDRNLQDQYEKYLQHLLLYQIENDRLRLILSEWDSERSKYNQKTKEVDVMYQTRLQALKRDLANGFEARLQELAQQNNQDLQKIREIYNRRLVHMTSQSHNLEDTIQKLKLEIDRKKTTIQIVEANNEDLMLRLEGKTKLVKDKEEEINQIKEEFRKFRDQEQLERQQKFMEYERRKEEVEGLNQEGEDLKDQLQALKGTIMDMREQLEHAEEEKNRALEKKQQITIRCLALEQEIQEFKSRKTQHNMTDYNKSYFEIRHSPHPSVRTLDAKGQEQEKEKSKSIIRDFRSISEEHPESMTEKKIQQAKADSQLIIELRNRISELNQRIADLQGSLKTTQNDLIRAEQKIKQQQNQIKVLESRGKNSQDIVVRQRVWGERLGNMQRALQDLNQEWIKKQRELGHLFKNIESNYLVKLSKQQETIKQINKTLKSKEEESAELVTALADKAREVAILRAKVK